MTVPLKPSASTTVDVALGERAYDIIIGRDVLQSLGARIAALRPGVRTAIVTDRTVAKYWLKPTEAALAEAGIPSSAVVVEEGESSKSYAVLEKVCESLIEAKIERNDLVIALGGGVVGDLAGFSAAILRRGVDFVQVPTSLLAQVDSSVGGKTGINSPRGKNLIGAFHQPVAVIADTDTLNSLPDREISAGIAEVIKYGCIWDLELLGWLDTNMARLRAREPDALTHAIYRSCSIKAAVVAQDEREQGLRAILNFGHTFGHAIEAATGYEVYLHGEAVGLGMLMAADLSRRLGLIDTPARNLIHELVRRAGLPIEPPRIGAARALELMQMDKKVLAGTVRLVLLERLGNATVVGKYDQSALEATLQEHFA
jgi:3-dehydroquinate synthase